MPLSFFDLPRELRDEVYLQHFLRPGRYEIIGPHPPNHGRVKSYNPHFLRTTSQIYCEASPFLYRRTVFKLQAPHQSYQWINTIGPSNASQIREVQLESSFLTRDVDEAGQRIAAQTWAKVLRSMPGLHRLSFSYVDSNSNSWTKIIYQNDQKDLANALDSLHELRDISINGVLPLAMVNNKTYLETLILYDDMEAEEGRSIESYFDALPRLRHLSLRSKATIVSPGFFAHVSPLHTLQWILPANLQFTRLHLEGIVNRHSISLHELRLGNTRGQAEGDDRLEIEDFQWLVLSLPHLEKLYITNPHINSSLVAMVPTHPDN
ncbi:MAG: hypothetical protein M1836_001253 [Candelina mexicana]|nr:MAG: hypothetical protein M1836_001253 [Candelina mexicana]